MMMNRAPLRMRTGALCTPTFAQLLTGQDQLRRNYEEILGAMMKVPSQESCNTGALGAIFCRC